MNARRDDSSSIVYEMLLYLVMRELSGESNSYDANAISQWKKISLTVILANYSPCDVYNDDETGLFWQLLPARLIAQRLIAPWLIAQLG